MSIFQRYIPFVSKDDKPIYLHVINYLFQLCIYIQHKHSVTPEGIGNREGLLSLPPLTPPPPLHSNGIVPFQNYTFARLTKSTVKIVLEEIYLNYKWD